MASLTLSKNEEGSTVLMNKAGTIELCLSLETIMKLDKEMTGCGLVLSSMRMKEWIGKRSTELQERSRTTKTKDKAENEELNPGQQLLRRNHIRSNKLQRFNTGFASKCLVPFVRKLGQGVYLFTTAPPIKGNASEFKELLHPLRETKGGKEKLNP